MKTWSVLIAAAAIAAFLLLRSDGHDDSIYRLPPSEDPTQGASGAKTTRGKATPTSEAPQLASSTTKVVLNTGPQRADEPPQRYRFRQQFIQAFEATREKAKLTDEQVDRILLAIYDYEQNSTALDRDLDQAREGNRYPAQEEWVPLMRENIAALSRKIEWILEPWQEDIWNMDTCAYCLLYAGNGVVRLEQ